MLLCEFQQALHLVQVIYTSEKGAVGGDLHLILDDKNCESSALQYCWEIVNSNNAFLSGEALNAEKRLLVLLSKLNYAERMAIANEINWWESEFDPSELTDEQFNPISLINTWIK